MSLTLPKKEIMNKALDSITINIGKAGINDNVVKELKRQLKSNEVVKLRFAKNVTNDKEAYLTAIVEKTRSKLVDLRGNAAVIYKKKTINSN